MIYHVICIVFTLGYYWNVMAYLGSQDHSIYPIKVYQATVIYHFMCCVVTGENLNFTLLNCPDLNYSLLFVHYIGRFLFIFLYDQKHGYEPSAFEEQECSAKAANTN